MKKQYVLNPTLLFFCFLVSLQIKAQSALQIDAPSSIAGTYPTAVAYFSGEIDNESGDLVLVDDGVDVGSDGCENMTGLAGKIALIDRGNCNYTEKALNAQIAGAIAVVICNNEAGNPFMMPGNTNGMLTIPAMLLDQNACNQIKMDLSGATATIIPPSEGETCISAISVMNGQNQVPEINSGFSATVALGTHARWYQFKATENVNLNISSCDQGVDTRLIVIPSADCEALSDHLFVNGGGLNASIDDCDDGSGNISASELSFPVTSGESYYVIWDDAQSSEGFTFELTTEDLDLIQMTFFVDMNNVSSVSPNGAYIAGDFTNWIPQPMTNQGGGLYSATYFLEENSTQEYRFLNGITDFENILGDCASSQGNRTIQVPSQAGTTPQWCFNLCLTCPNDCGDPYYAVEDNFENYTIGDISNQNSNWTTWPGADLGGQVTTDFASSGEQSVKISGADFTGQDVLYLLGDQTSGHLGIGWQMYIPENKEAYFNVQHAEATGNFAFTTHFEIPDAYLNIWDEQISFEFPHDEWFSVAIIVDLDNDLARLIVDDVLVETWTFSIGDLVGDGTDPAPADITLGAINFFGFDDSSYNFYIDDLEYVVLPKPLETQYCQSAKSITSGIHQIDAFDCLGGFDFEEEAFSAAWYTFTPDSDGFISVSSCGNGGNDTRVWLFVGDDCTNLNIIGVNDDQCFDGALGDFASYREAVVEEGKTYWIVWDTPWEESGFDFELQFNPGNPTVGNFCQTAQSIDFGTHNIQEYDGNAAVAGPNLGTEAGLGQTPYLLSEWFQFTPMTDMEIDIFSCELTNEDTRLWIYTGDCETFDGLELIASNDDDCAVQSGVYNLSVTAGTTYYIEWDNNFDTETSAQGHDFVLQVSPAPVEVTFSVDMSLFTDFGGTIMPEGMHLAGNFQGWNPTNSPMTDNGDGTWSITVELTPGEEIFYKYVLGDEWSDGNEGMMNSPLSDCGSDDGNGGFNRTQIVPDTDIEYTTCYDRCVTCDLVNTDHFAIENTISIFPNPTSDILNIQFEMPLDTEFDLRLKDNLGRTVIQQRIENGNIQLDLSELGSGVYFLTLFVDDFVLSRRVVVD